MKLLTFHVLMQQQSVCTLHTFYTIFLPCAEQNRIPSKYSVGYHDQMRLRTHQLCSTSMCVNTDSVIWEISVLTKYSIDSQHIPTFCVALKISMLNVLHLERFHQPPCYRSNVSHINMSESYPLPFFIDLINSESFSLQSHLSVAFLQFPKVYLTSSKSLNQGL